MLTALISRRNRGRKTGSCSFKAPQWNVIMFFRPVKWKWLIFKATFHMISQRTSVSQWLENTGSAKHQNHHWRAALHRDGEQVIGQWPFEGGVKRMELTLYRFSTLYQSCYFYVSFCSTLSFNTFFILQRHFLHFGPEVHKNNNNNILDET